MESINLPKQQVAHMLLCSFRYAFGKQTYITTMCAEWIYKGWDLLAPNWQQEIHDTLADALRNDRLVGGPIDQRGWKRVLDLPLKAGRSEAAPAGQ